MEYELKQYIRDERNCPMGVMVATVNEENPMYVHIGVSLCHEHDKFDKTIGYNLAKDRVKNPNNWYKIKSSYGHHTYDVSCNCSYCVETSDLINRFIDRCSAYFKNKMIVLPKIEYI